MLHYCDKKYFIVAIFLLAGIIGYGQYLHLSNIADNSISFNHAGSGCIQNRSELGLVYRDQGSNFGNNNFTRLHIYGSTDLTQTLGMGFTINNLRAGEGRSQFLNAVIALPYHIRIKGKKINNISLSPLLSYSQLSHKEAGNFILEENLLGSAGSDVNVINKQSVIQSGLSINTVFGFEKINFRLGYEYLPKAQTGVGVLLNEIHKIRAATSYQGITEKVDLHTTLLYQRSGNEHQLLILPSITFHKFNQTIHAWNLGIGYRVGDAMTFMVGASLKNQYKLYFSYDYTTSGLAAFNNGRGAIELGLAYILQKEARQLVAQAVMPYEMLTFPKQTHKLLPYKIELSSPVHLVERKEDVVFKEENNKSAVLSNSYVIYHEVNKIGIKSISLKEHVKLLAFIQINKDNIDSIEITSYTDAKGSNDYNYDISSKRAKALKNDIVQSGLPQNKVTWKGLGEINLLNDCHDGVDCIEDKHNENRRTVVRVFMK